MIDIARETRHFAISLNNFNDFAHGLGAMVKEAVPSPDAAHPATMLIRGDFESGKSSLGAGVAVGYIAPDKMNMMWDGAGNGLTAPWVIYETPGKTQVIRTLITENWISKFDERALPGVNILESGPGGTLSKADVIVSFADATVKTNVDKLAAAEIRGQDLNAAMATIKSEELVKVDFSELSVDEIEKALERLNTLTANIRNGAIIALDVSVTPEIAVTPAFTKFVDQFPLPEQA